MDPPNHDHAVTSLFRAAEREPNTLGHLAAQVQALTYATLASRDKLDELVQLLRWKFEREAQDDLSES